MEHKDQKWVQELERLEQIIAQAPLDSAIKWGSKVYTVNGQNVLSIGGFKNFCTIWFYQGVFLKDAGKVLHTASDGKTKALRQWRFTHLDQIDETKVLAYILEAIEIATQGIKIKPQKFEALEPSAEWLSAFAANEELETAFKMLTPGKQKEYILYINEAKQIPTKLSRIQKVTAQIMEGKGLHDKYKK